LLLAGAAIFLASVIGGDLDKPLSCVNAKRPEQEADTAAARADHLR
jgi:hypothetical protein